MKHEEDIKRLLKDRAALSVAEGEHREQLRSQLLAEMRSKCEAGRPRAKERWATARTWAWITAAAALLIFALAQVQFTLSIGDTTLRWGKDVQNKEIRTSLENLQYQVESGLHMADLNRRQIRSLRLEDQQLRESFVQMTAWLAQQQQLETETRFQDLKRLIHLTGLEDPSVSEWLAKEKNNVTLTKSQEIQ